MQLRTCGGKALDSDPEDRDICFGALGSESKAFPPQVLSCKLLIDGYNLMYCIGYAQAGDVRP
ncbi:MAG: hypothetical protein ACKOAU_09270, partial [Pirellula sp.]